MGRSCGPCLASSRPSWTGARAEGGPPLGLVSRLATLLLISRPSALWMRRDILRDCLDSDDDEADAVAHALVLAGVAHGVDASVVGAEHGVTEAAVEAACYWLLGRPEKTAVMIGLGLPQLAETC